MPNKTKEKTKTSGMSKSEEVAIYYGFIRIDHIKIDKSDCEKTKSCLEIDLEKNNNKKNKLRIHPEEKIALLRNYFEKNLHTQSQPLMIYQDDIECSRREYLPNEKGFHLDILGTTRSIAEAMLIKTSVEILKEEGFGDLMVEINSIGDRDSISSFSRELNSYYKKNISVLPTHCREMLKNDPLDVLMCQDDKCKALSANAPQSISCLSENSKKHFSEILEYLEELGIPYKINNELLQTKRFCSGTIFEIKNIATESTLAIGVRYNGLSKKLGFKKDMGAVCVYSCFESKNSLTKNKAAKKIKPPQIYFIQFGFSAKLKSLEIIETLRKEKILVHQALIKEKLSPQMQTAENMKVPYTLIMGQKEALENTIIVRHMATRSQETVPISSLAKYLKKIDSKF